MNLRVFKVLYHKIKYFYGLNVKISLEGSCAQIWLPPDELLRGEDHEGYNFSDGLINPLVNS
jgi:hypothetical protein